MSLVVQVTDNEILSLQTIDTICKDICNFLSEFAGGDTTLQRFGDLAGWENNLQAEYHKRLQELLEQKLVIQFENLDLASQQRILLKRRECVSDIINQLVR